MKCQKIKHYKSVNYSNYINHDIDGLLKGIYIKNLDSIFLIFDFKILIIDENQKLVFSKEINDPSSDSLPEKIFGNYGGTMGFIFNDGKLYGRQNSGKYDINDLNKYNVNIEAYYDFNDFSIHELPVNFHDKYFDKYYGDADMVFRILYKDSHIFAFNATPDIVIYNLLSKEIRKMKLEKSIFQSTEINSISIKNGENINQRIEHLIYNPLYGRILYDKYNDIYYRFFNKEQSLKKEDNSYNSWSDKETILMVYSNNFKLLNEINLSNKYLPNFSFVNKSGLNILKILNKKENETILNLKYDIYNVN